MTDIRTELDRMSIDQLHGSLLHVSKNCFEVKRLCATVLVSASVLVASFTSKEVDHALFVAGGLIILFFWSLDSQSYYIQEKLRSRMKSLEGEILVRHELAADLSDGVGMPLSVGRTAETRSFRAFFNASMLFYALLGVFDVVAWLLYICGAIG